jgi:hypothetical protein
MRVFIFALTIVSFLILPSLTEAQKYNKDERLILYLPFDEGEGDTAFDQSMYGNDGELDFPEWVDGKHGGALEFNGQSDVVIIPTKNSDELNFIAPFDNSGTVEAWFLVKGAGNSIFPRVLSKEANTGHIHGVTLRLRQFDKLEFELCAEAQQVTGGAGPGGGNPKAELDFNIWYHGAGTWEAGEHIVYINGEEVARRDFANPIIEDRDIDLRIGGSFAGPRNFEGIIDEVRIWNRVLPQAEIQENMSLGRRELMSVSPNDRLTTTWGRIKARLK